MSVLTGLALAGTLLLILVAIGMPIMFRIARWEIEQQRLAQEPREGE